MDMVEVNMSQKNHFVAFLSALQKRSGESLVPCLLFQRVIHLFTQQLKMEYFSIKQQQPQKPEEGFERKIKLITLIALVNKYSLIGHTGQRQVNTPSLLKESDSES